MAEKTATNNNSSKRSIVTWGAATNGGTPDTFTAVELGRVPYAMMVQATGTFGAGASIALHGSLDGTNYYALKDRSNTAIAVTAAGVVNVGDAPVYIKPVLTSGDGSTAITVTAVIWHESN